MRARRQRQDVRVFSNGRESDGEAHHLNGEVPTPTAGLATPRRIVRSLTAQPACVTQLVQLDSNHTNQPHRVSSNALSLPSDCSISEVRSELCSVAVEEQGDISMSSVFDHKRMRHVRKASVGRADVRRGKQAPPRGGGAGGGGVGRGRPRRRGSGVMKLAASRQKGAAEVEGSILSYSDTGSFYSCESLENSSASRSMRSASSGSCRSISFTAISESVPSCSLTIGEQIVRVPAAPGWGGRGRRNQPAVARKHSGSFGSIFGGGIDPYNGTSVCSNPAPNVNMCRSLLSQSTSLSTALNSIGQGAAGTARTDFSLGKRSMSSEAALASTVAMPATPSPEKSKPSQAAAVVTSPAPMTVFSTVSSGRSPEELNVTQREPKPEKGEVGGAPPQPPAEGADGARRASQESHGKRRVVTIAGASPTKRGQRSSLLDTESPDSAVSTKAAAVSSPQDVGATADPHSPLGHSGREEGEGGPTELSLPRVTHAKREARIGRGSYGDVYRGVDLDTGRTIAIKEILVPKDFTKDLEKQLMTVEREIRVMRKLQHPNIINYLGATRDDNSLNIYMEFISGGTVGELLRDEGALLEERTRGYTAQLLCGLEYLHNRQIVHRDLKGDNLFLGEGDTVKLGDFGTSKELVTTLVTDSVAGTPNFMAPEVIACSGHSYAADIWSVGCCVLEMLTGLPPFAKLDNHMAVMFAVMKGKLEEQVPETISGGARDFIKVCTMHDPKDRWTVAQLRQHPWLLGEAAAKEKASPAAAAATLVPQVVLPAEEKKRPAGRSPRSRGSEKERQGSSPQGRKRSGGGSAAPPQTQPPSSIPPLATGRKPKSAVPLEPSALAKASVGAHLPVASKSPAPHSEDGEGDGTTSSDPCSSVNSPGSRSKAGRTIKRGASSKKDGGGTALTVRECNEAAERLLGDVAPPLRLLGATGGPASQRGGSNGRPLAGRREGSLAGSGAGARTQSSLARANLNGAAAAPLVPHRPSPRAGAAKPDAAANSSGVGRRRSDDDSKTHSTSGNASAATAGGSPRAVPSPPSSSPTSNPRRNQQSVGANGGSQHTRGSTSGSSPFTTSSVAKEKRKKVKLST